MFRSDRSGGVGPVGHAPSRPSSLDGVEAGALPSGAFVLTHHPQYYGPLRLLTRHRPGLRLRAYTEALAACGARDPMRSPLLPCWLCEHSAPPTPESSSGLLVQSLHPFRGLRESLRRSALSCSPCGANMSALQDSLHGTDCWLALPSQEVTALHHTRSPWCSGSLLRGSLAITTAGLAPASHQNLARHTMLLLGAAHPRWSRSLVIDEIPQGTRGT
jgi:hypothetical protein